jgi:predicted TIM-barrel fold metal-dependent hydrolase
VGEGVLRRPGVDAQTDPRVRRLDAFVEALGKGKDHDWVTNNMAERPIRALGVLEEQAARSTTTKRNPNLCLNIKILSTMVTPRMRNSEL